MQAQPRVLCLDGGGIRGLAEILILKELMLQVRMRNRLNYTPEPRQCFDYICGTSTGGLIAVLIGRLGKSLDECEALFTDFGSIIFSGSSSTQSARLALKGSKHNSAGLADIIRREAGEQVMFESESEGVQNGHVPVSVLSVSGTTRTETLFRTYGARAQGQRVSVIDACRATSAATTFFDPIIVNGVSYVDGAFGVNNPSGAALRELESGEGLPQLSNAVKEVGCLVSIGAGRSTFNRKRPTILSRLVPKGIESIADAAGRCVKIATDCHTAHENVRYRFQQEHREDNYYRFDVDAGLESIGLNEADGSSLEHIASSTMAYLKGQGRDLERCALGISPRERVGPNDNPLAGLVTSFLPNATDSFHGRDAELSKMGTIFHPNIPGRKGLLIYGIGGCGKTQLALRHIRHFEKLYAAIFWIDASTEEYAKRSFAEAAGIIRAHWPRDLPSVYAGSDDTLFVTARLRATLHTDWLLVIDSAENTSERTLASYIPGCDHGSILITSTRHMKSEGLKTFKFIYLNGLDAQSSTNLLLAISERDGTHESEDYTMARKISTELSCIPLALKQAGGLIREGTFSFADFLQTYKTEYVRLMTDVDQSDEERAFGTILDMAYQALERNSEHAALLILIGLLGSWQIPVSLLESFEIADLGSQGHMAKDMSDLQKVLRHKNFLRLGLRRLAKWCLVTIKESNAIIESVMIHRVLCQWCLEKVIGLGKQDFLLQAAYGLAKSIPGPLSVSDALIWGTKSHIPERRFAAPLYHCIDIFESRVMSDTAYVEERLVDVYAATITRAAWISLNTGAADKCKKYFKMAVNYETSRNGGSESEWPTKITALPFLCGVASAYHRDGNLHEAQKLLQFAVGMSKELYGEENEHTLALINRCEETMRRRVHMRRHDWNAVQSSTKSSLYTSLHDIGSRALSSIVAPGPFPTLKDIEHEILRALCVNMEADPTTPNNFSDDWANIIDSRNNFRTKVQALFERGVRDCIREAPMLLIPVRSGHEGAVKVLIEAGADVNETRCQASTPSDEMEPVRPRPDRYLPMLHEAVMIGHEGIIHLLLESGANIEARSFGQTALHLAALKGQLRIVQSLLDKGANIDAGSWDGSAIWLATAGHFRDVVTLLVERGAHLESSGKPKRIKLKKVKLSFLSTLIDKRMAMTEKEWTPMEREDARKEISKFFAEKEADLKAQGTLNHVSVDIDDELGEIFEDKITLADIVEEDCEYEITDYTDYESYRRHPFNATTILLLAVETDQEDVAHFLLEHGANIEARTEDGETALACALKRGFDSIVEMLLEHGADVEARDEDGVTLLLHACSNENKHLVKSLLEIGANTEARTGDGDTALTLAAGEGFEDIVEMLLEQGADIEATNDEGDNAYQLASDAGYDTVAQLLQRVTLSRGKAVV